MEKMGVFTVIREFDLKNIALAAREYVEKHHSEEKYVSKLESIYLELIDNR